MNEIEDTPKKSAIGLIKYCPVCKALLEKRSMYDILIFGFLCANDHNFFVPVTSVKPNAYKDQFLRLKSTRSERDQISEDWLNNRELRFHLNDQVAEVLRIFLEKNDNMYDENKQHEAAEIGIGQFCPLCGEAAKYNEDSEGGYSIGLRCNNGHNYSRRGFRLNFGRQFETPLVLCLDYDHTNLFGCTKSFLTKPEWKKMIAPQVLDILKQYADEFLKDDPNTASS